MATVYRIENPDDGMGPFWNSNAASRADRNAHRHGVRVSVYDPPGPYDDYGLCEKWKNWSDEDKSRVRFGFANLDQLKKWFSLPARRSLARQGFRIAKVEASDVIVGFRQVIFPEDKYEVVEYLPMYRRGEK